MFEVRARGVLGRLCKDEDMLTPSTSSEQWANSFELEAVALVMLKYIAEICRGTVFWS